MSEEFPDDPDLSLDPIVLDGAYVHFVGGFTSLIFFQDRVIPTFGETNVTIKGKRTPMLEVRMSVNSSRKLSKDIENGFLGYQTSRIVYEGAEQWAGIERKNFTEEISPQEMEIGQMTLMYLHKLREALPERGKYEFNELLTKLVLEHVEEIHEMAEKYPETRGLFDEVEKGLRKVR
jgi:hypothetical protein